MKIPSLLFYKTYVLIQHCSVPLPIPLQYLCHVRLETKSIYNVREISQTKTNQREIVHYMTFLLVHPLPL